jgi:hypothetical protein
MKQSREAATRSRAPRDRRRLRRHGRGCGLLSEHSGESSRDEDGRAEDAAEPIGAFSLGGCLIRSSPWTRMSSHG